VGDEETTRVQDPFVDRHSTLFSPPLDADWSAHGSPILGGSPVPDHQPARIVCIAFLQGGEQRLPAALHDHVPRLSKHDHDKAGAMPGAAREQSSTGVAFPAGEAMILRANRLISGRPPDRRGRNLVKDCPRLPRKGHPAGERQRIRRSSDRAPGSPRRVCGRSMTRGTDPAASQSVGH
jgi:hypothetical protein